MMKRHALLLALLTAATACAEDVKHKFLAVDNGNPNQLIYIDQFAPEKSWTVRVPGSKSRDLQILPNGRVLASHSQGAAEYDLATGKTLWSALKYGGVQTARRLPNGNTLLGSNSKGGVLIREIDRTGESKGERLLEGLQDLRLMRLLPNGNVLLTASRPYRAVEVDAKGAIVWSAKLPSKGYKAARLPDGRTVAGAGGAVTVLTFDKAGKVVATVGGKDKHPTLGLDFCSGFDRLANGNIVMANWLGHGKEGKGVHLAEFDADNRVVWTWADHKAAKSVTNVLVLE